MNRDLRPLTGRRAIVTGGARGIGAAVASRLARDGADVTATDISTEEWELPGAIERVLLDVTDVQAVDRIFARAMPAYDVVIANAGTIFGINSIMDTPDEDWAATIAVNLTGVFNTVRSAARRLLAESAPGRIVVTVSIAGLRGVANATPYCASKSGAIGLVRAAARELAPHGILINAVCPGEVDTALHAVIRQRLAAREGVAENEILRRVVAGVPVGRMSSPDEIAGLYAFLVGPDGAYMTGASLPIDGGVLDGG